MKLFGAQVKWLAPTAVLIAGEGHGIFAWDPRDSGCSPSAAFKLLPMQPGSVTWSFSAQLTKANQAAASGDRLSVSPPSTPGGEPAAGTDAAFAGTADEEAMEGEPDLCVAAGLSTGLAVALAGASSDPLTHARQHILVHSLQPTTQTHGCLPTRVFMVEQSNFLSSI